MIILTAAQAERVRGNSPTNLGAALDPVPIKPDLYMLGEEVLADPAHADVRDFLSVLPIRAVADSEKYLGPRRDGTRPAGHESDDALLAARAVPDWRQARTR